LVAIALVIWALLTGNHDVLPIYPMF
jgi:hypothetical protein